MIAALFGFGDRGRARKLVKLAERTIEIMESMIGKLPAGDPGRTLIEEHLARRVKALKRYSMLARGETDDMEMIAPTLRNYETWKRSMQNEIEKLSSSAELFLWYLKQIKNR